MARPSNPEHLRLLKNDKAHQHRYRNSDIDVAETDETEAPEEMSDRAKEIFVATVNMLQQNYQLSDVDIKVLVIYSNNQEQLEALEMFLRQEGLCCETLHGAKERPEVKIHKDCKMLAVKMLESFKKLPKKKASVAANPFSQFGKQVNE